MLNRRSFLLQAATIAGALVSIGSAAWAGDEDEGGTCGEGEAGGTCADGALPGADQSYGSAACRSLAVSGATLKARYESIDVYPPRSSASTPWTVRVGVVPYLNGGDEEKHMATPGWGAKDKLVAALRADPEMQAQLGGRGEQILVDAHCGKASPEDLAVVLQLVAYYRPPQFDDSAGTAAGLRAYYRSYLGLDCTGFAGNFSLVNNLRGNPSDPPKAWATGPGVASRRARIEDFCAGDAIVYTGDDHVAVIDRRLDERTFVVVESCGEGVDQGLVSSRHTFSASSAGGAVFSAIPERRPTPRDVWVVSL